MRPATRIGIAIGPVLMGVVFDAVGSYETLLIVLAGSILGAAALMQAMPPYESGKFKVESRKV